jgi:hypothetical protein
MLAVQGYLKYEVVTLEYFSKWIEAKALATITSVTIQKFFRQNIICRFRVSKSITIDNSTQFDFEAFRAFCNQVVQIYILLWSGTQSPMGWLKGQMV